jgi:hypothetical protein
MRGWAERQLERMRSRKGTGLLLIVPPAHDPSVTRGLVGEPLIPRRGGWGALISPAGSADREWLQPTGIAESSGVGGVRVRWNLMS